MMTVLEWRVAGSLAAIYAVRMLGLFMILPVFTLYAQQLPDASNTLIGLAIGIYGLAQACLQVPLGMASDRFGRKPVILFGLSLFAFGSLIAAMANDSITWIIIGRLLQGSGAIAAVTMALAADLIREEYRARVMGIIGMTIGLSFALAMILGPLFSHWWGMASIFWITAGLACAGMVLLLTIVPTPNQILAHRDAGILKDHLVDVLKQANLLRMNFGVFVLHLIMTANFTILPSLFEVQLGIPRAQHWEIYLPVLLLSFIVTVPMIIAAEKYHKIKILLLVSIVAILLSESLMALSSQYHLLLLFALCLFFIGFNFLEATQPSLVAKYARVDLKGTAMGVFNSAQFLGIFLGGLLGGSLQAYWGTSAVFWFNVMLAVIWYGVVSSLPTPQYYQSRVIRLGQAQVKMRDNRDLVAQFQAIAGVMEVFIDPNEQVAYLKIDTTIFRENSLQHLTA